MSGGRRENLFCQWRRRNRLAASDNLSMTANDRVEANRLIITILKAEETSSVIDLAIVNDGGVEWRINIGSWRENGNG